MNRLAARRPRGGRPRAAGPVLLVLAGLAAASAAAREAELVTADGRIVRGELLAAAAGWSVRPPGAAAVPVDFTALAALRLQPAAAAARATEDPAVSLDGWLAGPLGEEGRGRHELADGRLVVAAAGTGLRNHGDAGWFVHRALTGDSALVARVGVPAGGTNAFAGLMVRDNLGGATAFAAIGVRGDGAVLALTRTMPSASLMPLTNAAGDGPVLLRLAREGQAARLAWSRTGTNWNLLSGGPLNLGARVLLGFLVSSGAAAAEARAEFAPLALGGGGLALGGGFPRVILRDGSVLAAPLAAGDASGLRLGGELAGVTVPPGGLARVEFVPPPPEQPGFDPARPGALLESGDFVEGRLRAADARTVTVDSLVFGPRRLNAGGEAVLVQAAAVGPAAAAFIVRTAGGSAVAAASLAGGEGFLEVENPVAGRLELPLAGVTEVVRAKP